MPVRPLALRAALATVLGGALAVGLVAPATAASAGTGVVSHRAAATSTTTRITAAPKPVTVVTGRKATFKVGATGSRLTYQWYVRKPGKTSYAKVTGATRAAYSLVTAAKLDGARYRVVVKGAHGAATSRSAALVVVTRPSITKGPAVREVVSGGTASFSVTAKGHGLTYSWQIQRVDQEAWVSTGVHTRTYTLTARTRLDGASVRVLVSNKAGRVASDPGELMVRSTPGDPVRAQSFAMAGDWFAGMDYSDLDADAEVAAASAANPVAPAGWTYVTSTFVGMTVDIEEQDPSTLDVRLRGADGKLYAATGLTLPAPSGDLAEAAEMGFTVFAVGALLPDAAIKGATWSVTGAASEYFDRSTAYFAVTAAP
jgi:hypothetical protein